MCVCVCVWGGGGGGGGNSPVIDGSPHKAETVLFWLFHQGNSIDQTAEQRKISINVAVFPMFTTSMLCHRGKATLEKNNACDADSAISKQYQNYIFTLDYPI